MASATLHTFTGPQAGRHADALARLRITVFREFPYLYDGSEAYERDYLAAYFASERATVALAFDGEVVVGATTALPLPEAEADFRKPFEQAGYVPGEVYYFGESVLLPAYRGQGLGKRFMRVREARARETGHRLAAFCAVARPENHPLRPPGYRPLDGFWQKQGFTRHDELTTTFAWKDIDQPAETGKTMVFWLKALE
jgi:GNAT superfamily N-acetyltransferase